MSTEYKQLSLREAAKFDYETKQKEKLTGWGIISKQRAAAGVSRKARRKARAA
jgi:hypothetical protein